MKYQRLIGVTNGRGWRCLLCARKFPDDVTMLAHVNNDHPPVTRDDAVVLDHAEDEVTVEPESLCPACLGTDTKRVGKAVVCRGEGCGAKWWPGEDGVMGCCYDRLGTEDDGRGQRADRAGSEAR